MNTYLRNLIVYFENVLNPDSSASGNEKIKRTKSIHKHVSPESFNIRGGMVKKQEKLRPNPAP